MNRRSYKSLKITQRAKYSIQKSFHFLSQKSCKNIECSARSNGFRLDSCGENLEIE
jgi:hypothetical protein